MRSHPRKLLGLAFALLSLLAAPTAHAGEPGKCSFDSDCAGNGKCKGGKCGACNFDSDCKVGRCKSNQCGGCNFDSDCKGGKCSSGQCTNK